jgi:hypothetical protein
MNKFIIDNIEYLKYLGWIIAIGFIIVFLNIIYPFIFTHKFSLLPFGHKEYSCEIYGQQSIEEEIDISKRFDPKGTEFPIVIYPNKFDLKMNYFGNRYNESQNSNWGVETSEPLTYCSNYCMRDANFKQCGPRGNEEKNIYIFYRSGDYYNILLPVCTTDGTRLFDSSYDNDAVKYNIFPEYFAYARLYYELDNMHLSISYSPGLASYYACSIK